MFTPQTKGVNEQNCNLLVNSSNLPYILRQNGEKELLPPSPFGQWYAKTATHSLTIAPEAKEWYYSADPAKDLAVNHLLTTAREYQTLAVRRMLLSNTALWLDMGLGKTFIVLAYCLKKLGETGDFLNLIVCPPTVFGTWEDEIHKHIAPSANVSIVLAHGNKRKQGLNALRAKKQTNLTFILTSFETLETVREYLQNMPVGSVFFDEAQKIKHLTAARTKTAHKLVESLRPTGTSVHVLSGTPSTTSPVGYYSLYELLWKGASGCNSLLDFKNTYTNTQTFVIAEVPQITKHGITKVQRHILADNMDSWLRSNYPPNSQASFAALGYQFSRSPRTEKDLRIIRFYPREGGVKNIAKLNSITRTCAYVLKKEDVLKDLPEKIYIKRSLEMTDEQKEAYVGLATSHMAEIQGTAFSFKQSNSPFIKLHQIANGFIKKDETVVFLKSQPKLEAIIDIIEENENEKIVLWSPFRAQIDQITEYLSAKKLSFVALHGGIAAGQKRNDIVRSFQNDTNVQILVANPAVAGIGLNLTCSSIEVFITNWYSPDVREQAEDRLHRSGQKSVVRVVDLVMKKSIEEKILKSTLAKIDIEGQILTTRDIVGE